MTTLDWRELVPPQDTHECDCDYCDRNGDPEPVRWLTLVPMVVGDTRYITDRRIMIRADLAPIPADYEGDVLAETTPPGKGFLAAAVSDEPATGKHFRWDVLKAVELGGWRLRLLIGSDACAVVTTDGEHIGWAMPVKVPREDVWDDGFTREYREDS